MRTSCLLFAALLLAAEPLPDPELAFAERVLKDAGIATDGPGLIAFFKARTLTSVEQERLAAAVRSLGDDNFEVREKATRDLITSGRLALPYVRPALADKDLEVVSRAKRAMEEIERVPEGALIPAAALLLASRHPDGATEALLGALPWLDDEALQESMFQALASTGMKDGIAVPALMAAAKDREPTRRAAAAFALGRGNASTRGTLTALRTDAEPRVRFYAAAALLRTGDRTAVAPLFSLLTDAPVGLAWQTEDLLYRLAGDKAPSVSIGPGTEPERRKTREEWEGWWKVNGDKIDLSKVNFDDTFQNTTLIAELDGRVWESGPDGTARWQFNNTNRPIDARSLPGGRVLVAEHGANRVTERDRKGTILWEQRVTSQPVACQRLPNGNTFIATYQDLLEVTPLGKVVYTYRSVNGMIYHGEKLRDGRFVYITSNSRVYELDAAGRQTREVSTVAAGNTSGWASVESLANGHYLVALYSANRIAELDADGKMVWQCSAASPGHASRLRNGNTLVANIEGRNVVEYDRGGKEVWSVKSPGRPFHAWRR